MDIAVRFPRDQINILVSALLDGLDFSVNKMLMNVTVDLVKMVEHVLINLTVDLSVSANPNGLVRFVPI